MPTARFKTPIRAPLNKAITTYHAASAKSYPRNLCYERARARVLSARPRIPQRIRLLLRIRKSVPKRWQVLSVTLGERLNVGHRFSQLFGSSKRRPVADARDDPQSVDLRVPLRGRGRGRTSRHRTRNEEPSRSSLIARSSCLASLLEFPLQISSSLFRETRSNCPRFVHYTYQLTFPYLVGPPNVYERYNKRFLVSSLFANRFIVINDQMALVGIK